jgi:hypothetical protein
MWITTFYTSYVLAILDVRKWSKYFESNLAHTFHSFFSWLHHYVLYYSLQQKVPTTPTAIPNGDCWKRCMCVLVLSFPRNYFYLLCLPIPKALHISEYQFRFALIYSFIYDIQLFSLHHFQNAEFMCMHWSLSYDRETIHFT